MLSAPKARDSRMQRFRSSKSQADEAAHGGEGLAANRHVRADQVPQGRDLRGQALVGAAEYPVEVRREPSWTLGLIRRERRSPDGDHGGILVHAEQLRDPVGCCLRIVIHERDDLRVDRLRGRIASRPAPKRRVVPWAAWCAVTSERCSLCRLGTTVTGVPCAPLHSARARRSSSSLSSMQMTTRSIGTV